MSNCRLPQIMALIMLLALSSFGQLSLVGVSEHLYKIEAELMRGEKAALFRLAEYFDSNKKVVDFLGYHRIETTESEVAKRMVHENTIFAPSEISITKTTSKKAFLALLKKNEAKIVFLKSAGAFLITPLEERNVDFEVITISDNKRQQVNDRIAELLQLNWVKNEGIDQLIANRDPAALYRIALHLFDKRNKWNRYYYDEENDLDLLQYLTGTQIVVKNHEGAFSHDIGSDYPPDSRLNLLIFFTKNYKGYTFDSAKRVFVNPLLIPKTQTSERLLFEKLFSEDDDAAFDAFIKLTEIDPSVVIPIAEEHERSMSRPNSALPTFPFRFLKNLAILIDYCKRNGIDYRGSDRVRTIIKSLKPDIPLSERYALENKTVTELSLDDVTAFEYWAAIYSSKWDLTHSAGRILDKVYSRNWVALIADEKRLKLYLKKSKAFVGFGIIGVVNKYLDKFIHAPDGVIARVKMIKTEDKDIQDQVKKLPLAGPTRSKDGKPTKETLNVPNDLKERLEQFAAKKVLEDKEKEELVELLSRISYEQIGVAVSYLEGIEFKNPSKFDSKFEFLTDDWGFDLVGDFDNPAVRKEFVENYSKMTQSQLYAFYLDKHGFDFRKSYGSVDLDKIYEMLKYDVVQAFAGGGGGRREEHIYPLVKLLENHFGTSLGFVNKLCQSKNIHGCSSSSRANAWLAYLRNNKHLVRKDDEPVSFTYRN